MPAALAWTSLLALAVGLVPAALRPEEVPFQRDLLDFFLPMKALFARCVLGGDLPWWDPWTVGGQPFFANLQSQVLYAPNWIFAFVDLPWSFSLYAVLHLGIAAAGALLLSRAMALSWPAALLAAAGFAAGGFAVSLVDLQNQLCSLAWLPWCWLAAMRYGEGAGSRALAGWAAAGSMALLAGEPQLAILALGSSCAIAFVSAWTSASKPDVADAARRTLSGAAGVAALVSAACAVQIVPFAELLLDSNRMAGDWSMGGAHSLAPRALLALVIPPTDFAPSPAGAHVRSLFVGPVVMLLVLAAGLQRTRRTLVLAGLAAASILLALGPATPVGSLVNTLTPFLRYPVKYFAIAALALPLLAGHGLDIARDAAGRRGARTRLAGAAAWLAALATCVQLGWAHRVLTPSLPASALLEPSPVIRLLMQESAADGPRVHATRLNLERLGSRAERIAAGDLAGAMRERVELLEGGLPAYFGVHSTWGATAMTVREQADLLELADGPLATSLQEKLHAAWLIDDARRILPLDALPIAGGAARLYSLPPIPPFPKRTWTGPNTCHGAPGLAAPSSYPGWREVEPGSWRFRPTGLVPLALLSGGAWLALAWLAAAPRRRHLGRDGRLP
jgi:hypothetical protein